MRYGAARALIGQFTWLADSSLGQAAACGLKHLKNFPKESDISSKACWTALITSNTMHAAALRGKLHHAFSQPFFPFQRTCCVLLSSSTSLCQVDMLGAGRVFTTPRIIHPPLESPCVQIKSRPRRRRGQNSSREHHTSQPSLSRSAGQSPRQKSQGSLQYSLRVCTKGLPAGHHHSLRDGPLPLPQGKNLQAPVGRRLALLSAEAQQVVVHVGAGAEDEDERGDADRVPVGRLEVERWRLGERRSQVCLRRQQSRVGMPNTLFAWCW